MWSLKIRMFLLLAVLFAILYGAAVGIGVFMGVNDFYFYLFLAVGTLFVQYLVGPKLVEWSMHVRYVDRSQHPRLFEMVEDLARKAGMPVPRIGIAQIALPNAFAFGRGVSDGRVCVTQGILSLLDEGELKAVLGHELSHLKNRDVLTITLLSVIPLVLYRIAFHMLFYGGRRRESGSAPAALIGLAAFLFYFVTNLLVLYGSRIREYFADRGSIALGNPPSALASALYKLVYGAARADRNEIRDVEGLKAFFVNDPSRARNELKELADLDKDRSGTIDSDELLAIRRKEVKLGFGDVMMEVMSTHPNMLKRIKHLSEQG